MLKEATKMSTRTRATTPNRYAVKNTQTQYTLFSSGNLERAKHIYHCVPRRKYGDIILMDNETGEILKIKLKKNQ